jgi:transcription antitermination protein NusB
MRRQSRELAMQILFQSEFTETVTAQNLSEMFTEPYDKQTIDYAETLTTGVLSHIEKIDAKISAASRHWKMNRMSGIDRNVLRVATYEMFFLNPPLKQNIAIDEAIDIAKKYGTTDSAAFVNGVLDQVAKGK